MGLPWKQILITNTTCIPSMSPGFVYTLFHLLLLYLSPLQSYHVLLAVMDMLSLTHFGNNHSAFHHLTIMTTNTQGQTSHPPTLSYSSVVWLPPYHAVSQYGANWEKSQVWWHESTTAGQESPSLNVPIRVPLHSVQWIKALAYLHYSHFETHNSNSELTTRRIAS